MAYKEGSLGVAILIGFVMFFVIDMVLGLAFNPAGGGYSLVMGGPLGTGFSGMFIALSYGVLAANGVLVSLDILVPVVCGIVAGLIARGSAGRGFVAGFAGVLVGYFIYFLMAFVVGLALTGGAMFGLGAGGAAMLLPLVIMILVVPIILGIFAGIGGALMSAITATQVAGSSQPAYPVSTTIIAPSSPAPMIFQGGGTTTQAAPSSGGAPQVICPSCKTQNEQGSTFCQSCGTRLKG